MTDALLDSKDSPESIAWQLEESARAASYLQTLPFFDRFTERLHELATEAKVSPLVQAGQRWFQQEAGEFARVIWRDSPTGPAHTLFDAANIALDSGLPVRLVWFVPSPDGNRVAIAQELAGVETVRVSVWDVESGAEIPTDIPWYPAWPVAWLPDSSGFYIDSRTFADGEFAGEGDLLFRYEIPKSNSAPTSGGSTSAEAAPETIPGPLRFPRARVSADGRYVSLVMDDRVDYVRTGDGSWEPFLLDVPGSHVGEFWGEHFFGIVNDRHARGRLVRIPVESAADPHTWTELVAESADVLLYVSVFEEHLVLGLTRNLTTMIEVRTHDGELVHVLELPEHGTAGGDYPNNALFGEPPYLRGTSEISFTYSTPLASAAVYRYELATESLTQVTQPAIALDGYVVEQHSATSADGTAVPYTLVRPTRATEPMPTVIEGYGNFGLSVLPSFNPFAVPVLEAGAAYVLAHLRGGGEFGIDWWEAGKLTQKQHTFDDLYAIAEALVESGVTTPGQLAFHGASGGGLTAGAALVQRPELFGAIIARSPVLDLLTREGDPLQDSIASREYGALSDPAQAAVLRSYSPVHNVRDDVRYPATLFVAGENDPRTKAWQSRKMAALVQRATSGSEPILLRVHLGRGHAAVGAEAFAVENGEWLAFAAAATGMQLSHSPLSRKVEQ